MDPLTAALQAFNTALEIYLEWLRAMSPEDRALFVKTQVDGQIQFMKFWQDLVTHLMKP